MDEENENYIFAILNLLPINEKSANLFYENVRGIILENFESAELTVGHEDLVLLCVLTLLHPQLPAHIREQFSNIIKNGGHIFRFRTKILSVAEQFLALRLVSNLRKKIRK